LAVFIVSTIGLLAIIVRVLAVNTITILRGTRISPMVIRAPPIRTSQPIACVQFELFNNLVIYQFK